MRVGVLAPPWVSVPPPAYGGIELMLDRLARGLRDAGHDVTLFTTGDSTCPVERRWVLERAETLRMGAAVPELRHVLAGYEALAGCDVVHDHTLTGPLYAERFPRLPAVTTNHAPFSEEMNALYRAVSPRMPVIAISQAQASQADGVRIAGVVHHGLDVDAFPFGGGRGGYFLFLGRMAPEKGARRAALVAQRAGVPLVMAAKMNEPLERAYFEEQVRPLLSGDITFIGEVGGAEKVRLLREATGLINPIRWPEPFGLVMLEALACGTPVLSFKEGAAPEIVDHGVTGFLCVDIDDMADAVARVGEIDRAACRERAAEHFSVERMVAGHVAVYEQVIAERAAVNG
jgi:glycosyltransferase involved in cell wall biosynthesis